MDDTSVGGTESRTGGVYLLHLRESTTAVVPLPSDGELLLGSSQAAALQLASEGVAPLHARIVAEAGAHFLSELPGCVGTLVNDRALRGCRLLASGDVITIGESTLVVQLQATPPARRVLASDDLLQRLGEEVERSLRYERSLALLVIEVSEESASGETADAATLAAAILRRVDLVGRGTDRELEILLPETSAAAAAAPARRLLAALAGFRPRAGLAVFPDDGASAVALLEGARAAAGLASVGELASPQASPPYQIGGQRIVAVDGKMTRLLALVRRLASSDLPVLVTGETGVGKEAIVARAIHSWSPRSEAPLVVVNCAAIPDSLLESELFGHAAGAFTGAAGEKPGLLESASGGTVLLDEIGECTPRAQAELLRVLETGRVRRLGALAERSIDIRVIAATNRDLAIEVEAGRFRKDLFYRLSAATVVVPPLRDRPLDVPALARAFLEESCRRRERAQQTLMPDALRRLELHAWPGNVRELKNAIEYAAEVAEDGRIEARHLPENVGAEAAPWLRGASREPKTPATPIPLYQEIRELEARRIHEALAACDGVRVRAAERLAIPLRTLVTKIKEHGLQEFPHTARAAR